MRNKKQLLQKLKSKIVVDANGCWIWQGKPGRAGYGGIEVDHKPYRSHRLMYMLVRGAIPMGLELDHLCRVKMCCNPDHLEAVTHFENCRRGISGDRQRAKTHCPEGHPYDEENTYVRADGERNCRACARDRARMKYTKEPDKFRAACVKYRENNREYFRQYYLTNKEKYRAWAKRSYLKKKAEKANASSK